MGYRIMKAERLRLENTQPGHSKWYEVTSITADWCEPGKPDSPGHQFTLLRYGKIGSSGGSGTIEPGPGVALAKEREKKRRGYVERFRTPLSTVEVRRLTARLDSASLRPSSPGAPPPVVAHVTPAEVTLDDVGKAAIGLLARAAADPQSVIVEYAVLQAKWGALQQRFQLVTSQMDLLDGAVLGAYA
jgi:hypothetical protein